MSRPLRSPPITGVSALIPVGTALMGTSGSPVLCEMRGAGDLLRQQPAGEHLFRPGREVLTQDRAPAGSPGGWTADGVACPALAVSTERFPSWHDLFVTA